MQRSKTLDLPSFEESRVSVSIASYEDGMPLLYVNQAFERTTLYMRDQILGKNCRFLQGEKSNRNAVQLLSRAIRLRRAESVCLLNYRANGEAFHNLVIIHPIQWTIGNFLMLGCQYDLSLSNESQHIEEHLVGIQGVISRLHQPDALRTTLDTASITAETILNRTRVYFAHYASTGIPEDKRRS